eukprot:1302155-Prymnesium_polylepis.1
MLHRQRRDGLYTMRFDDFRPSAPRAPGAPRERRSKTLGWGDEAASDDAMSEVESDEEDCGEDGQLVVPADRVQSDTSGAPS